jgi:hypothetical protein
MNFSSCKDSTRAVRQNTEVSFFDPMEFGAVNNSGRLSIETRFSECGEWGGHKEQITVYADSNKTFHADYRVFPFNCDSLPYYVGNENPKLVINKTVDVHDKQKKAIIEYIARLTQSKINERFVDGASNTGNVFSITNSDSTFFIWVRNREDADANSYNKLVHELFN